MTMPAVIQEFISAAVVPGDICLPFHYPADNEFERYQVGFRTHGITGENLTSSKPGGWQPGWYVIALNGMDDPFFVDVMEDALNYPVYYAAHGAGSWTAIPVAPGIVHFSQLLAAMPAREQLPQFLETHVDIANEFWKEVYESALAPEEPESAPADMKEWVPGTLLITAVGEQKMKVVQYLKEKLDITPAAALQLSKQPEIVVQQGYLVHLRRVMQRLESLGATVVFKADD